MGSDSGVNNDDITNDTTATFTGLAGSVPNDSKVHLRVNGVNVRSTTNTADGSYSVTLQAGDLSEGENVVDIIYVDPANNTSGDSPDLTVVLDTVMATPAAPDLRAASDTGSSDTDNLTGDDAAWFDGFAEPGSTVQIFVGAAGKGIDTADAATGAWSIQLDNGDLAVGANDITVTATDVAGNTATSPILVVTYDGGASIPNAPLLSASSDSGSSDADGITNIAAGTIYGSVAGGNPAEGGATVHVRSNKNGGGWVEVGTTVADSNGNWSYTLDGVDDLAEGTNLVDVYITDLAGDDSGDSGDLFITLDTTANDPAVAPDLDSDDDTGDSDSDNITSETAGSYSGPNGSVEADSTVWLRIDGSNIRSVAADGNGAYSITLLAGDMTEGAHLVDIIYIDITSNSSGDSPDLAVTLDTLTVAPETPNLAAASDTGSSNSDNLTNDTTATFIGLANSVEGNSTVYLRVGGIDKRSIAANADGSYSITLEVGDLNEGANLVDIYYQDLAGNVSANGPDLTVTLDTAVADPALPDLADASDTGSNNSDDITAETRPTIQGTAGMVEGLSTVRVWLDTPGGPDLEVGATTAAADGSWSYTFTSENPLEEGDNIIHVAAVDPAGNVSNNSANLTVTVDFGTGAQSAPALDPTSDTGSANDDNITADNTPTITGACPVGAEVKLRTNAVIMATFTDNDANDGNAVAGMWSYTFSEGDLNEGVNTVAFLTIDTQNNTSDWSQDLVVTLDTNIQQPTKPNLITADDSGSDSGDDITNETAPTISGTAEANSTVTVDVNGAAHTDTTAADANGSWSYTLTDGWLNEGANTIFVSATDVAGNVSAASADLIITLDTTVNAPSQPDLAAATDTGGSNSDNITRHANPRIVGTADPDTNITIRLDPEGAATVVGTTWADGLGNWSYTFAGDDLAEGANVIDVLSTDIAGNNADSVNLTITIETVINAPAALDLEAASDLGNADDDDLTSLAASTITGSADPNCTVYIRINGTEVGSTTSDGLGDWSYTFDGGDDLVEGINIIDAYAEDAVGNLSDYSNDLVITLDTTVATPAAADLETADDSGLSDVDNYTNVANAAISGACEAGATITISLNGNDSYDTTADQDDGTVDGLWSYTFAGGLNGSVGGTANIIKAAQQDRAGNISAFGPTLTITLDDAAQMPTTPDLLAVSDSGDADEDNLTNIINVTITGAVETNSSLQLFIDQGAGPALADTISEHLISTGAWNYTFASGQLAEGANQITVVTIDKADNISAASTPLVITLDTAIAQPSLPDLTADSDTGDFDDDEITSDETPTFLGLADPNVHVTIRVDGEPINTADADLLGDWSYTFAQGEIQTGVHRIDVAATDAAGNVSVPSDDLTIWLNVEPTQPAGPNLLADSDSGSISTDNLTNITTPVIDGKADANCTVFVYVDEELIGSSATNENGFWQYTFSAGDLSEGDNEVTIITEDSSGLRSSASYPLTITLDTTLPTAPLPDLQPGSDTGVSNSDNLTSDETATIDGITEASALVDLYLNNEYLTQLTATVFGNWSYTFAPGILTTGENDIYIYITDRAGNLSSASEALTIILDVQQDAPEAPVITPETDTGASEDDGLTNNPHPEITGTVKPNSSVEVRVSGVNTATVSANAQGNWQHVFDAGQLNEGLNYVEIISTDPVGNTARSEVLELTLDTIAPVLYNYSPKGVYTYTTHIIELYINGDDLDSLAAYDTAGYILMGAGGDGGFADGNEWIIPISGVTIDTVAGLVQINTIITLTDDDYRLIIDPSISLRDEAGNAAQLNLSSQQEMPYDVQVEPLILEFTIDTEGPPAPAAPQLDPDSDSGSSDSDNITNENDPLIHITADPEITVELICNGRSAGFANETTPGEYYLIIENSLLREGENLLLARAFDSLGNSSDLSDSQTFIYDRQGPEVAAIVVDSLWLNFGPTQITTVFAETDIDPATIESLDTYILLGSGGDGTFDDGNEITITPTAVVYDSATRSVILTMPQTVAGYSELGPDTYQLTVSTAGAITDLAGNTMTESASQTFAVVPAVTIHSNQRRRFTTADQTTFTVAVVGQGDAVVLLGEAVGSENTIDKIIVGNSNENTRLKIRPAARASTVTVGQILIDSPIKAVRASRVDITQQIDVSQGLSKLKVGTIYDNTVLNLTSNVAGPDTDSDDGLRIYTGNIGQDVQFNISGHLRLLKTPRYQGGAVTADSIYAIRIKKGDMGADIDVVEGDLSKIKVYQGNLTGDLNVAGQIDKVKVPQGQLSTNIRAEDNINLVLAHNGQSAHISAGNNIGKVKFKNNLIDSTISAANNIAAINIRGDAIDNLFLAGADLGPDGQLNGIEEQFSSGDLDYLRVIGSYLGSITAAGVNPGADLRYFTPDDQAASIGNIARVKFGLHSLDQTSASDPFGILASGSIKPFSLNGQLYESPFELNQFHLAIVE
ncbi:beta strand repeat-containing protein [Planctomycetota bacterium]